MASASVNRQDPHRLGFELFMTGTFVANNARPEQHRCSMATATNDHGEALGRCHLPGIDLPLDHYTVDAPYASKKHSQYAMSRFPNAMLDWGGRALTLRERAMINMMTRITDQSGWETGVFDKKVTAAWRAEHDSEPQDYSDTMFDFVRSCLAMAEQALELTVASDDARAARERESISIEGLLSCYRC